MRPEDEELVTRAAPPDRSPPHSAEAEEHVIACCLIDDGSTLDRCINERLEVESFYYPAQKVIFGILMDMRAARATISLETLAEELKTRRQIEAVGGFPYLMQVTGKVPTTAHAGYFIEKVREKSILRELIRVATGAVEQAYAFTGGLDDFMADVEHRFMSIGRARAEGIRLWKDAAKDADRRMDEMLAATSGLAPGEISWGFPDMDRYFEPMQPGQLVTLAARPSVGKSSLMRQIVHACGVREIPSFVASLEVKDYSIARSIAQSRAGISYRHLKRHRRPEDIVLFKRALTEVGAMPIHTLDDFSASTAKICAQARLLHGRRKLGFMAVDHIQEIPDGRGGNGQSTTEALGEVAKTFKALAGELEIPVMILSQLNRSVEHENREPRLHDLRASGDIEQASDKVVLLGRPNTNPMTGVPQAVTSEVQEVPNFYIKATQAKGRDDGTSELGLMFRRETATFIQIQL